MHWHGESNVARRDDRLGRVRRLTYLIAGGATAASVGLATVLGVVIPGRAAASGIRVPSGQSGQSSRGSGQSGQGSGQSGRVPGAPGTVQASPATMADQRVTGLAAMAAGGLKPPSQPPAGSSSPPVVSSGGS